MKKVQKCNKNIVTNSVCNTLTNFFKCCRMKMKRNNKKYMDYIEGGRIMPDVLSFCDYIVFRFNEMNSPITNLKLQKILYYVQGYFFKKFGKEAFPEEIYNWQYGPVVPVAYYEYNKYGAAAITQSKSIDLPLQDAEKRLVDSVIAECLKKTASQLVGMTHNENPWKNSDSGELISKKDIKVFFLLHDPLVITS